MVVMVHPTAMVARSCGARCRGIVGGGMIGGVWCRCQVGLFSCGIVMGRLGFGMLRCLTFGLWLLVGFRKRRLCFGGGVEDFF